MSRTKTDLDKLKRQLTEVELVKSRLTENFPEKQLTQGQAMDFFAGKREIEKALYAKFCGDINKLDPLYKRWNPK